MLVLQMARNPKTAKPSLGNSKLWQLLSVIPIAYNVFGVIPMLAHTIGDNCYKVVRN